MKLQEIINDIKKMTAEPLEDMNYGHWIDEGVKELEDKFNEETYNQVIAEASSETYIYKRNNGVDMPKMKKREMIKKLLKEHGLTY